MTVVSCAALLQAGSYGLEPTMTALRATMKLIRSFSLCVWFALVGLLCQFDLVIAT